MLIFNKLEAYKLITEIVKELNVKEKGADYSRGFLDFEKKLSAQLDNYE